MLPLLSILLAAAAPPEGPLVVLPGRDSPVSLSLEALPTEPGRAAARLAWRAEGAAMVGGGSDGLVEVEVRLEPEEAGLAVEVRFRALAAGEVGRQAVRLRLPGPARAVGRDLSFARLERPLRVDRGTPVAVAGGDLLLVGGPGLAAARYVPGPGPAGPEVAVDLVADDAASHPFAVYPSCLPAVPGLSDPAVPVSFAALEHKRPLGRAVRAAGEEVRARARLYPLVPGRAPLPLVLERWPGGARAAFVLTDHADRTDPAALRALLHGDSRGVCRAEGPRGLLGHGLRITKSFFSRARRGGLDERETRELAEELRAAGSEVATHSPTAEADDREAVEAAVPGWRRLGVVTWIDHQPYTNCEAISSEGWRDGGRHGVRDLLAAAGIRWVWEAGDVAGFGREPRLENLFAVGSPGDAVPPVFPLPVDRRLWAFASSMFQGPPRSLAAALSGEALDRLERERGLFVGHTYLSASPRTTARPELVAGLVVREIGGGALELDPDFDEALGRVAERVRAGTMASLTLDEAAGRLRDLGSVQVRYRADGAAVVENLGERDLAGLTVSVPAGGIDLAVEGAGVLGRSSEEGSSRVWFDLPAGGRALVRAGHGDLPLALVQGERPRLGTP